MKKNVFGRHFKRDANERKALFKNLLTSLVLHERIITSEAKAKAIKSSADKLVTKAKKGGNEAYKALAPDVNYVAVEKLIKQIAPRFMKRDGGYTRIIKIGNRIADNSPEVIMEWTEKAPEPVKKEKKAKAKTTAKKVETSILGAEIEDVTKETKKVVELEEKAVKEQKSEMQLKKSKTSILKQLVTRQKKG